jgi:hypothetical protein
MPVLELSPGGLLEQQVRTSRSWEGYQPSTILHEVR